MKLDIISFTKKGGLLNQQISESLNASGYVTKGYTTKKHAEATNLNEFNSLKDFMEEIFTKTDGIIFIGACGIAVRAIAPHVRGKEKDPAVLVLDENGTFVISLLSGHIGGGNKLCQTVSKLTGGTAVITTATDVNQVFAVDNFAMENNLKICNIPMIKVVSGSLLDGKKVGLYSQYPIRGKVPEELTMSREKVGVCISNKTNANYFEYTLSLVPKNLVIGIGCKRNSRYEDIYAFVEDTFQSHNLAMDCIIKICSIDVKENEEGILQLAKQLKVDFITYSKEILVDIPGCFSGSDFVLETVGVDNVCERSAAIGSGYGKRIIPKQKQKGITLSVYEMDYQVQFD